MQQLRLILLALAIGVAAVLAGAYWISADRTAPPQQPEVAVKPPAPAKSPEPSAAPASKPRETKTASLTPAQQIAATRLLIETRLAEASEYRGFFEAFAKAFPKAHERMLASFADTAAKAGRVESPDLYLAQALRGLRASHGVIASGASPEKLERVFALQSQILSSLAQTNPRLCADFLYGAASKAFFDYSTKHRKLVAEMAEAGLDAIVDGREKRIQRPAPDAQEFAGLEDALKKAGLEKPEIDMLLDARVPDPPLADATICKAGQIYYQTLRELPEEARIKIYALAIKLLARS